MSLNAKLWFAASNHDRRALDALMREEIYAGACFHAQQCVEKAIKGILVACDVPLPKSHSISDLIDKLPPFPGSSPKNAPKILRLSAKLDRLYLPMRYPDAVISQKPIDEAFDAEDAIAAKNLANRPYELLAGWALQLQVPLLEAMEHNFLNDIRLDVHDDGTVAGTVIMYHGQEMLPNEEAAILQKTQKPHPSRNPLGDEET